jgi:hypothetical protein
MVAEGLQEVVQRGAGAVRELEVEDAELVVGDGVLGNGVGGQQAEGLLIALGGLGPMRTQCLIGSVGLASGEEPLVGDVA